MQMASSITVGTTAMQLARPWRMTPCCASTWTLLNFNFATPEETKEAERKLKQLEAAEEKGAVWAECEICSKWRLLPASITSWPGKFSCSMNPDTTRSSYDAEEETVSQL
jgi:hypothetical protein